MKESWVIWEWVDWKLLPLLGHLKGTWSFISSFWSRYSCIYLGNIWCLSVLAVSRPFWIWLLDGDPKFGLGGMRLSLASVVVARVIWTNPFAFLVLLYSHYVPTLDHVLLAFRFPGSYFLFYFDPICRLIYFFLFLRSYFARRRQVHKKLVLRDIVSRLMGWFLVDTVFGQKW